MSPLGQTIAKWKGLRTLVMVREESRIGNQRNVETRKYISSLEGKPKLILRVASGHSGVENGLHWGQVRRRDAPALITF